MSDVSIMINAKDNFSGALTRMQNAVRPFKRDVDGLQGALDALNHNKVSLQVDMAAASRTLQAAKREYAALGRAAEDAQRAMDQAGTLEEQAEATRALARANEALADSQQRLAGAQESYNAIRENLGAVSREAQRTQRDLENLARGETERKKAGPNGFTQLAQAGAIQMVGEAASDMARSWVGSAYGDRAGTMFSSVLGGASSGAAIGSAIAPGIGTAIGAAAGGLIGAVQGGTQLYEQRDEAFKSYVQQQTEDALARQNETLARGTTIAAQRETNALAFGTLFGDKAIAAGFLDELTGMAARTPFEYDDLTGLSKTLKPYGYDRDHILPTLGIIGDAGAALGMSTADMGWVATSIGRMNATGKTSLEYINPLQERGIDAVGALSKAYGVEQGTMYDMISKGEVSGQEAARTILQAMAEAFAGSMSEQSQTMTGLQSTLEDANAQLAAAKGEGYNEERKKGIQAEIDFLSGETGAQMEEANRLIGQWKASLENQKEEINRDIMSAVMNGTVLSVDYGEAQASIEASVAEMREQYVSAMQKGGEEGGEEAGRALARAEALGISAYNASDGAQEALKSNLELAAEIREDTATNTEFYNAGQRKADEYNKGLADGIRRRQDILSAVRGQASSILPTGNVQASTYLTGGAGASRAFGLDRVPYDNYPALLHQGERVLTAREARQQDAGRTGGAPIQITMGAVTIREEADIERVASALYERIRIAQAVRKP